MKRLALVVLLWPAIALAQFAPQEWSADQDGMNNACYDVAYFQANNLAGGGVVCVNADNTGKLIPAACAAAGVSSVTGTATRLSATPTTGAVVVDLIATSVTPGSYTYAAFTVDAYGRLTVASSGTAPVTSIGVTAPITTTGGTTPTIGISLPASQLGYGTGTNVTSSSAFQANAVALGVSSQQEIQIFQTSATVSAVGGFRICLDAACAASFAADMIGTGWAVGGGLTADDVLFELNSGANTIEHFSNFGASGAMWFQTGGARATRMIIDTNVKLPAVAAPASPAAGLLTIYEDSTSLNFAAKNASGTVNHGAQTQTAAAGKAFTALSDAGAFTETSFQAPISPTVCGANTFGTSVSSAGALTCTQPNTGNITGWPAATDVLVSAGVSAAPVGDTSFTFDTTAHVMAGGNAIGVNGASVPTNASMSVGHTTQSDRDRVQFAVGGGSLGATGTSDNTFVDVTPASTTIRAGVTGGIYATERIRAVAYTSGAATTPTEAATVYIDGPPTAGGAVSTTAWGLHVAAAGGLLGSAKFDGNIRVVSLAAGGVTAVDTTGIFGIAGVGGLPAAVSGTLPYYINVTGSTLVTGGAVWLATSSTAGQGGTALEYVQSFAATNVALNVRIITNAITGGTLAVQITRNGSSFSTITLNNVSSGTLTTGTVSVGSPSAGDRWGVLVSGSGTTMAGNMVFTADLLMAPNVF